MDLFELTHRIEFSASHRLFNPSWPEERNLAVFGACANPHGHGHNYAMDVTLRGGLDADTGMVMDLNRLAAVLAEQVVSQLDHKHLNHDVPWLEGVITTAENVAVAVWKRLEGQLEGKLHRIRVYESARDFVDYLGPGGAGPG